MIPPGGTRNPSSMRHSAKPGPAILKEKLKVPCSTGHSRKAIPSGPDHHSSGKASAGHQRVIPVTFTDEQGARRSDELRRDPGMRDIAQVSRDRGSCHEISGH